MSVDLKTSLGTAKNYLVLRTEATKYQNPLPRVNLECMTMYIVQGIERRDIAQFWVKIIPNAPGKNLQSHDEGSNL
jgi:hypothetical protein